MVTDMMRYFVGFVVSIGLIIVLILLIFGGGGKPKVPSTSKPLVSYANTDATAEMTIDGPVNAPELHQQVKIIVSNTSIVYEELKGYDGEVVNLQTFGDSLNGFEAFLHALDVAGYTKGDTNPANADERGYCPLGDRYVFELKQDGKTIEHFWATTCAKPKTYLGNSLLTSQLFEAQVPNYDDLTANIKF
jgi:hypothetical protein